MKFERYSLTSCKGFNALGNFWFVSRVFFRRFLERLNPRPNYNQNGAFHVYFVIIVFIHITRTRGV